WATFVYDPLAHCAGGDGGWLKRLGALDFAGGTVVHISSGVSALRCPLARGQRRGYGHRPMQPHHLPMTVRGAGRLGLGWVAVAATMVLAVVVTWIVLKIVDALVGLRVSEEDEVAGLDLSQHSETAYALGGGQYGEFSSSTGTFAEAMRATETKPRPALH